MAHNKSGKVSHNNFDMWLTVNNRPIDSYIHEGNNFVEGRKGSEFEIQFRNNTGKRVLAVPSVDALSVFDGQRASPASKGYIVAPWSNLSIRGWTLDNSSVANFVFQDKERSYAVQSGDSGSDTGVVGVMVYEEELPVTVWTTNTYRTPVITKWPSYQDPLYGISNIGTGVGDFAHSVYNDAMKSATMRATSCMGGTTYNATATVNSATANNMADAQSALCSMGTGFGSKSDFRTTEVSFNRRATHSAMLVMYYDSARNLTRRGIELVKTVKAPELPNPFNMGGCTPPPGWQG